MSNSIILLCAAVASLCLPVLGQTTSGSSHPGISDLRKQYLSLNQTLYDISPDPTLRPIEKAAEVAKGSREILHKGILLLLGSYGNDAAAIEKGINNIQGHDALPPGVADFTNVPFADLFVMNGNEGAAIGYLAGDAPDMQPYLEFYTRSNGNWESRASVGEEYRMHTFFEYCITARRGTSVGALTCVRLPR